MQEGPLPAEENKLSHREYVRELFKIKAIPW